jgi:hypothetical protein
MRARHTSLFIEINCSLKNLHICLQGKTHLEEFKVSPETLEKEFIQHYQNCTCIYTFILSHVFPDGFILLMRHLRLGDKN